MAHCECCGAALPGSRTTCVYCGTRNKIDLQKISDYTVVTPNSQRWCPCCKETELETIDVGKGNPFYIEKCSKCGGLFFDNGELESILEQEVSHVYHVDKDKLVQLLEEVSDESFEIVYRSCPVCKAMMQRKNFGAKSGVIIDQCAQHGIWLDSGELYRLMEWKKSGGEMQKEHSMAPKSAMKPLHQTSGYSSLDFTGKIASSSGGIDVAAGLVHMLSGLF